MEEAALKTWAGGSGKKLVMKPGRLTGFPREWGTVTCWAGKLYEEQGREF